MQNNFDPLIIRGKSLIPVVQGGMGVGVSASKLSSAVARENGVGTIASVDLRTCTKICWLNQKSIPAKKNTPASTASRLTVKSKKPKPIQKAKA